LRTKLDSLQVLRAVAAAAVIFQHIPMTASGSFGVDIFFIISGFIICYITDANSDKFLLKRVFRVLPLYYFGTLAIYLIAISAPQLLNGADVSVVFLIKSLLFVPYVNASNAVAPLLKLGWTLNYEIFFYVIFALSLAISKRYARLICCGLLIACVFLGIMVTSHNVLFNFYSDPIILEFGIGIFIFILWKKTDQIDLKHSQSLSVLALAACVYFSMFFIDHNSIRVIYWGIPSAIVFSLVLFFSGNIRFPLWLVLLGDASFSLYLFHPYIVFGVDRMIFSMKEVSAASVIVATLVFITCCLFAIASYFIIEKRSNNWLRAKFL